MAIDWAKYLANGLPKPQGKAPPRKEIRELSEIEMYLFVEGLAKFQQVSMQDPLSYFQLAGIHGLPYETWPKGNAEIKARADFQQPDNNFGGGGFCAHSSIIFLTWHRPYLALFESTLYKHVNDIAAGIEGASARPYIEAAKVFRLPYWDWAKRVRGSVFPTATLPSYKLPNLGVSSSASIRPNYNPLAKAPFEKDVTPDITLLERTGVQNTTTVRFPGRPDAERELMKRIQDFADWSDTESLTRNLSERVSYILRSYEKFASMSYNAFRDRSAAPFTGDAATYGSLEDIHNSIHGNVGFFRGHMGNPAYAGFDPIFWLHHANIDRLFAIWQVLHQTKKNADSWVTERVRGSNSFTLRAGIDSETKDYPLYPFRKSVSGEKKWYTSDDTKWTEDFGYTYSETAGLRPEEATPEQIRTLNNQMEVLYPTPARQVQRSMQKDRNAGAFLLPQTAILRTIRDEGLAATVPELQEMIPKIPEPPQLIEDSLQDDKPMLRQLAPEGKYLEWLVNIKAVKHSLEGKYTIHIFLGDVDEEQVVLWPLSPNFVGTFYPFGQSHETRCEKCQVDQEAQLQVTSQIPLTFALMERYLAGTITDLTPDVVKPYLSKNLHWRVTVDGEILQDRSQVAGLTVFVVSNGVTLPANPSQPPIYDDDVTIYPEITTKPDNTGRGEGTGLAVGQE